MEVVKQIEGLISQKVENMQWVQDKIKYLENNISKLLKQAAELYTKFKEHTTPWIEDKKKKIMAKVEEYKQIITTFIADCVKWINEQVEKAKKFLMDKLQKMILMILKAIAL